MENNFKIVTEGISPDDFEITLSDGTGIQRIYNGDKLLYQRKRSYCRLQLDSTYGANSVPVQKKTRKRRTK